MKLTKKRYLMGFTAMVLLLAAIRAAYPQVAESQSDEPSVEPVAQEIVGPQLKTDKPHKIYSVPSFKACFPDTQAVQLTAAMKWGVKRVKNREDAEKRKNELVYVGANPYYHIDRLYSSIPYLVPRAAVLLQDIGQAFFDSLYVKGIPLHRPIVTSVLRSQEDVAKLRRHNGNATENSCHLYGTTFDICYNRYETVEDPDGPARRAVRNDSLKYVLSEVLRDMREQGRCYIKYEVKQGCFHMTVR
ncbi:MULTISPECIES: DUF5715 family protein [unclassified Prevotella]|uniref:DUF5715 family protein n=1 Tax=unclassified Prevotella TaxID=2638335 RepID=UPI00048C6C9A|nr:MULTISPECIES: DUF5715 family protein [unclassified Prevotella]